jgi:hypothetical protein
VDPSPLIQRYIDAAGDWRPDVEPEMVERNPDLALGAEWFPPPDAAQLERMRALGIDRVPQLAELYALHDGARLPSLGWWRLLPLAEVVDARAGASPISPEPPGDAVIVFSDDSEFGVGIYTSGPLLGAMFEYDEHWPRPLPSWRSLGEFLTVLLEHPDEQLWPGGSMPRTLPPSGPGDPNRDDDWRIAQQLYELVQDPASTADPLPLAMTMTPYEQSDLLLPYLDESVADSELAIAILGGRRWQPARARIEEIAEWPLFGEARIHNASLTAKRVLEGWGDA